VNGKKNECDKLASKAKEEVSAKEVRDVLTTYGYYLNKLIEETKRLSTRDYDKFRKALLTYTDKQIQALEAVNYNQSYRLIRSGQILQNS
jgi:hypothetical protein